MIVRFPMELQLITLYYLGAIVTFVTFCIITAANAWYGNLQMPISFVSNKLTATTFILVVICGTSVLWPLAVPVVIFGTFPSVSFPR